MTKRFAAAVAVIALLPGGCALDSDRIDADVRERVETAGDSAAMALVRTLSGQLSAALATGGPARAIEFCAGRAQTLTDSVSSSLPTGWSVRRTTLRTRNPRNAPDSLEVLALRWFHDAERIGSAGGAAGKPASYVQRTPAGDYRYYMPLRMAPLCLQCHGDRNRMDPAVRRVLDERYPGDQATGYADGELRGVVRVSVPATAVE